MKNLFKSAGSMFAFSNVDNRGSVNQPQQQTAPVYNTPVVETDQLEIRGGVATLSSRSMEYYD